MQTAYEWQIPDPAPDGTVSINIRMTTAEAAAIVTAPAGSDETRADLQSVLQDAVATGQLVLP